MALTFEDLDRGALFEMCDKYGVDYKRNMSKDTLINELKENGIRDTDIERVDPIAVGDPAEESLEDEAPGAEEEVLVKMTRKNARLEVDGYKFLRDHPFQIVPVSVADHLIENVGGFRVASPREAEEYYS